LRNYQLTEGVIIVNLSSFNSGFWRFHYCVFWTVNIRTAHGPPCVVFQARVLRSAILNNSGLGDFHFHFNYFSIVWCHICFIVLAVILPIYSNLSVLGMTLNCIHIFIVTGSFLYWCVMRPASQRFFIHIFVFIYESWSYVVIFVFKFTNCEATFGNRN